MRARWLPLLVLAPACSLVANLGDRTLATGDDAGSPPPATTTPPTTTTPPPTGDAGVLPSYCNGITLYATFDAKLTGDVGGAAIVPSGGVGRTPAGKFGGALSLVRVAGAEGDGASLFFTGNPWPKSAGSLAVWYRVAPGATPDVPVLYRPLASAPNVDPLDPSGLSYYLRNDFDETFGLYQHGADAVLTFPVSSAVPYLRPDDYNHFFTAWRQGTAPTAFVALNGGLGAVLGAPDDAVYPDAGTNGELHVPFRGFTSQPWDTSNDAVTLRLGGPAENSPDGFYDDLVIWNRVIGFDELAALYGSGRSVGAACNLP